MFDSQRHTFQRGPDGRCAQCPQDEEHWVHRPEQAPDAKKVSYQSIGEEIGALVAQKNKQYGSSFSHAGQIMRVLYPNGIATHQMDDALAVVRVIDKLFRIAQRGADGKDLGGESPWKDVCGYGILGAARDERTQAEQKKDG